MKNIGWYLIGGIGCAMIFCGLLWGMLIARSWMVITIVGFLISSFTFYYWPEDMEDK